MSVLWQNELGNGHSVFTLNSLYGIIIIIIIIIIITILLTNNFLVINN